MLTGCKVLRSLLVCWPCCKQLLSEKKHVSFMSCLLCRTRCVYEKDGKECQP